MPKSFFPFDPLFKENLWIYAKKKVEIEGI
jgi:hypothetical protein